MLTDKFKKNADALRHKKLFLLDMDGTITTNNPPPIRSPVFPLGNKLLIIFSTPEIK